MAIFKSKRRRNRRNKSKRSKRRFSYGGALKNEDKEKIDRLLEQLKMPDKLSQHMIPPFNELIAYLDVNYDEDTNNYLWTKFFSDINIKRKTPLDIRNSIVYRIEQHPELSKKLRPILYPSF